MSRSKTAPKENEKDECRRKRTSRFYVIIPTSYLHCAALAQFAEWSERDERHARVRAGLALVTRVGAREREQRTSFKSR